MTVQTGDPNTTIVLDCNCVVRLHFDQLPPDIEEWGWICHVHPGERKTKSVRRDLRTVIPL